MKSVKNKIKQALMVLFMVTSLLWLAWWIGLHFFDIGPSGDNFTDTYWVVPLSASAIGLLASRRWGGFKSTFGRTIAFFALGVGLQACGQIVYTLYYRLGDVELAFLSIGDVPYLLSNIFYIFAVLAMLRVLCFGRKVYKPWWITVVALAATGLIVYAMSASFLGIAVEDERGTIYQILNVAYPLIQSIYFLLGLMALLQSRILAGAKMFLAVTVMLVALMTQFLADFTFLYKSYQGTWEPGGLSDLIYLLAYSLMGLSIILINRVRRQALNSANGDAAESGKD
jgi:hypothetical protein